MPAISASEAISPALERTKQICFRPFKFSRWLKLAVVTIFTGEIATSSCSFNPGAFSHPGSPPPVHMPVPTPNAGALPGLLVLIPLLVGGFIAFMLLASYLWSFFRFTLLDTVLSGECRLRESWEKYHEAGLRVFGFYLLLVLVLLIGSSGLLVVPLLFAARAGVFRGGGGAIGYLLGAGLILLFLWVVVLVLFAIMMVFLKDFVVPVLALEDATLVQGWARVKQIMARDPGAFVVYILMKIVLAIASGIIFGIVLIVLLIPVVIVAVVVGIALAPHSGGVSAIMTSMSLPEIALLAVAGLSILAVFIYALGFISVPAAIFFESYALYFFGSRYQPLGALLVPEPSPTPYPIIPPQAPPDYLPPEPV